MPKLRPLPDGLSAEARDLAEFLRQVYDQIGTGVREYAHGVPWDAGTISRYLSGGRIPPQDFVDRLLDDAYPQHSAAEAEQEHRRGRDLRTAALQVCNSRAAEVERLAEELSDAKHEINLARLRERELSEALDAKQKKADALLLARSRIETLDRPYEPIVKVKVAQELESREQQMERNTRERIRAEDEIKRLRRRLTNEVAVREAAEKRRDQLQVALDIANAELVKSGTPAIEIGSYKPPIQLFLALQENRSRLGGTLNFIWSAAVICAGPFYLWLIYHMLPKALELAQSLTVLALVIPGWLAMRMWSMPSSAHSILKNLLQVSALISLLFLVGYLI